MKKLTAEKCRSVIDGFKWMAAEGPGMSIRDEYDIQAYEIALPILEQQEMITDSLPVITDSAEMITDSIDPDGWIEWGGGRRPVGKEVKVDVRFRSGEVDDSASTALGWRWSHIGSQLDIIAYRVIPERATNQNGEQ